MKTILVTISVALLLTMGIFNRCTQIEADETVDNLVSSIRTLDAPVNVYSHSTDAPSIEVTKAKGLTPPVTRFGSNSEVQDTIDEAVGVLSEASDELTNLSGQLKAFGLPGLLAGLVTLVSGWISGIIDYVRRKRGKSDE